MKQTEIIMGMPITIEIVDKGTSKFFKVLFDYFKEIDSRYSTYKEGSEITEINNGLPQSKWSEEMKTVLGLCKQTSEETSGYFNIMHGGKRDPSGLVKGWSIKNAADVLIKHGVTNFYIEAGGDIQVSGKNVGNRPWTIGIRNPFNIDETIKTLVVNSEGIATSGTYIRGQHIYNPIAPKSEIEQVKSLTVIGPDIYEADRFATAAFAMGIDGIAFIEMKHGFQGYMITDDQKATYTSGFERYVVDA